MPATPSPSAALDGFSNEEVDRFLANAGTPDETARFQAYLERHRSASVCLGLFDPNELVFQIDLASGAAQALVAERLGEFPSTDVVRAEPGDAVFREKTGRHAFKGMRVLGQQPLRDTQRSKGKFVGRALRRIFGTMLGRFAGSAMAALFSRKVMTLTVAEMKQLWEVVEQTEPKEK